MDQMADDDMALVRAYAAEQSERAFEAIVSRHLNLVYSVALRQTRDAHQAEEVTQAVFIILARKAATLSPRTILAGWLCRTARHVAANLLTAQRRRQAREQEAHMQAQSDETESQAWLQIAPLLDAALAQLGETDHNAIVLRFFEGRSFHDVGSALGTSEEAAKKRVTRAVEKLRRIFLKRGVALSAAAIAVAVSANSVQAAPLGLATSVTAAAVQGTAVTASTLSLIQTTLSIMASTKLKAALAAGLIAVLSLGTTALVIHHHGNSPAAAPALTFAGYATPEASVQSSVWAGSVGDFQRYLAGCAPKQAERLRAKMAGKSDGEVRRQAIAWANALAGYQIAGREDVSADEVRLHISARPAPQGLKDGNVVVVLRKIGSEWKLDGED